MNPFGFTRRLLGQKRSGRLTCTQDEVDKYLCTSYSDSARDQYLGPCSTLITPPEPSVAFNLKDPTLREVQEVVKAARTSSAPDPSGVPYLHGLQEVPQTPSATMEKHQSHLEEGESGAAVETCRGCLDS